MLIPINMKKYYIYMEICRMFAMSILRIRQQRRELSLSVPATFLYTLNPQANYLVMSYFY
jgi:hypothetical protein